MKKKFFYLALAAIICAFNVGCSSDDDEKEVKPEPANFTTPPYAEEAMQFNLSPELKAASNTESSETAYALKSINFSESGKILLELHNTVEGNLVYLMEDATVSNEAYAKVYSMNGSKVTGTIKMWTARTAGNGPRATRAPGGDMEIILKVKLSNNETVNFNNSEDENTVINTITPPVADEATNRLARTWNVLGAILDLKSEKKNIKAYEEFDSRNGMFYLEDVLAEALDQGVNLTEEEQQEFKRVVKNVTFTKTGLFIIHYADETEDVAEWSWANAEKTEINIRLKDNAMGNKFISDTTKFTVAYNGNRCNLKAETALSDKDNNDWEAVLILKLTE